MFENLIKRWREKKPEPSRKDDTPGIFIKVCSRCGNFHNWRLFRDRHGTVVEAMCLNCGSIKTVGS